jgi:ATP-dependent DNA helicase RecG
MYRYIPDNTLFPEEVLRYEPFVIREALNNCIAHQDYSIGGRINVVEREDDELIFTNPGSFLPPSVEQVVTEDTPQEAYYRNRFLVEAMANLKMVDTIGSGIRKMFDFQRKRFFPLPEYSFSSNRVEVRITGKVLDMEFARILALNPTLSLQEIILLDKVQKQKPTTEDELRTLRSRGLVEGRKANLHLSAKVVKPLTDKLKVQYVRQRGFDDRHYKSMILDYLDKFDSADRAAIDMLLTTKLPEILNEKQKKSKIGNLLSTLRKDGLIVNRGSATKPRWEKLS